MRNLLRTLLGGILIAQSATVRSAEFDRSSYAAAKLSETHGNECASAVEDVSIDGRFIKLRSALIYQGKSRGITSAGATFVRFWAKAWSQPESVVKLYTTEILVREGSQEHWVPIQSVLVEAAQSELKRGQQATFYLLYAGCSARRPIFLATEFEVITPTP